MKKLIFFAYVLLLWSCEMQPIEELAIESEIVEQIQGPYQVTPVSKNTILSLGKKLEKRIGFNVIESAQLRQLSDFTFDLEASQLTTDTLKRRTYSVPFLEKGDNFSTFNLVMVADSTDNVLEQYVLQYEFDSIQYQSFLQTKDLLNSGVTIKRYPFSTFFNDSNPGLLERCQGIFDSNGDPVSCDQAEITSYGSTGGGGGSSEGTVIIIGGSGGSGSGQTCNWYLDIQPCPCLNHTFQSCTCEQSPLYTLTLVCNSSQMRKSLSSENFLECMNCDLSDFGTPTFTLARDATNIDNLLGGNSLSDWHMAYLSHNTAFSSSLRTALQNDNNLDKNAALFTISAGMNGAFFGNFNDSFILSVEGLMAESEVDLIENPIPLFFQSYFDARYAILKVLNPSWSPEKLFYESAKEAIHLVLDGIGLIEGLGTPADLLNAGLYYLEGNRVNGNLSLVAATPIIGLYSTTVKGALRLKGIIPGTSKRISQIWTKNGDQILFSGTPLREAMGLTDPTKHAHHILPLQHSNHPVVQKAANVNGNPFHINELNNGLEVGAIQNTTHTAYNTRFFAILENFHLTNPNATPEQAYNFLNQQISKARTAIQNLPPNGKINDVIWK